MTPELLEKYAARVPRYTSYPTANHFTAEVGADHYARWLATVPPGETFSLYLHVPFCAKMCWYCGCHTSVVNTYEPVAHYRDLLLREIDLVAAALPASHSVTDVQWGGGTPTILTPDDFSALCERLRARFAFSAATAMSVEIDPRNVTREMASTLAREGTTRASLGVQDFDPAVQAAINRIQTFDVTARVVDWLREEGIADIAIDLIYGLPHQTRDSIVATVDAVMALEPRQVALFGYAHVPWMKRHQRLIDERALPETPARWALYWAAARRLAEHGMVAIGLDHFAAAGSVLAEAAAAHRLQRNFQGYTASAAPSILGFGASAIGTLPQGFVQNAAKIPDYREAILAGRLATARGRRIGADDLLRRDVIAALMCGLEADVGAICRSHGYDETALDRELASLSPLAADGIVAVAGRKVAVEANARPLVRSVCAAFDAYWTGGAEQRHAKAV